jgi:hypothetical protein
MEPAATSATTLQKPCCRTHLIVTDPSAVACVVLKSEAVQGEQQQLLRPPIHQG